VSRVAGTRRGVLLVLVLVVAQTGCTAMLLGSGGPSASPASLDLTQQVREKIAADSTLSGQTVAVSSPATGVITLRGRVATAAQKERAGALARSVNGVRDVDNRLALQDGS
jgi:hyperosmotically inducible protein